MTDIIDVILVEGDDIHFHHFKQALEKTGNPARLFRARDTGHLMELLTHPESSGCETFKPRLVFLELGFPDAASFQFLELRRQRSDIRKIPVVALSESRDVGWVAQAYTLGANSVIPKPNSPESYLALVDVLQRYWLGIVKLPLRD